MENKMTDLCSMTIKHYLFSYGKQSLKAFRFYGGLIFLSLPDTVPFDYNLIYNRVTYCKELN